jgi:hypothetical protein
MLTEDDLAAKVAQAFGEQASRGPAAAIDAAGIFRRGRRRRHRQIATGAVSVTAVVGLVAGLLIAGSGPTDPTQVAQSPTHHASVNPTSSTQPKGGQLPGNTLLDAAVARALSAAAADAGMPEYYVTSPDSGSVALEVRSSVTGKVTATVTPPVSCTSKTFEIAVAGNDRDFVFGCPTSQSEVFFRLRINSRGLVSAVTPLSIPVPADWVDNIALTSDGSKLAIGLQGYNGAPGALEVVTLATGRVRTWTGGSPFDLSWTSNGRELGFWAGGLRVLDVNAPGSKLNSARLILSQYVDADVVQEAMLSPDGTTIIASVTYERTLGIHVQLKPDSVVGGVVEIDAQTGKPLRTLLAQHAWHPAQEGGLFISACLLGSVDSTGNHLLVSCDKFGRLDRGRFTALSGISADTYFAAAW